MARKSKSVTKPSRSKVTFEFSVLDDDTKKRIASCIERRGKVTISMISLGKTNAKPDGFAQKID
ncbi:hypothetical protein [Bradyrhizobium sp.]|jgi:hypothetical protein|uniref:ApyA family aminopyruvatide-related RiPP n=1 Tax=Bradyrhizobium sp. TaxID=376 RepID=UPI002E09C1DB|nr:hypothetical protein [Bradyrhizobium sp.]